MNCSLKLFLDSLRRPAAALLGAVFVLSGLFKLMDPVGAALIFEEYFHFLHLSFLDFSAKFFGVALPLLEACLGAALITGVFRKVVLLCSLALLGGFTLLTLVLWIVNPTMDCGCFGELIHLSHAQSFLKNIVLLALCLIAFMPIEDYGKPKIRKYVSFGLACASAVVFGIYSLSHLPLIDGTDLKLGTELNLRSDIGVDSVPHLSIRDAVGDYCDTDLLSGPVMVVSFYDTASQLGSSKRALSARAAVRQASDYLYNAQNAGFDTFMLVTGDLSQPEFADAYFADRRTLLSLNRSNGGATLLYDGQVARKWTLSDYPSFEELQGLLDKDSNEILAAQESAGRSLFEGYVILLFLLLLLV